MLLSLNNDQGETKSLKLDCVLGNVWRPRQITCMLPPYSLTVF